MFSIPQFLICVVCGYMLYKQYEGEYKSRDKPFIPKRTKYIVLYKTNGNVVKKYVFNNEKTATDFFYDSASRSPKNFAMIVSKNNGEITRTYNISKEEADSYVDC